MSEKIRILGVCLLRSAMLSHIEVGTGMFGVVYFMI